MAPNVVVNIRPAQAPILDQPAEDDDKFHPVLTSSVDLALPEHIVSAFATAKETVSSMPNPIRPHKPGDDVVIIPLGTSSAAPSKYRNGNISNALH